MGLELHKDRDAETVMASANYPDIRAFTVRATASTNQGYLICNLSNSEEVPMFQFHTDDWDQSQLVIPTKTPVTLPAGWAPR